MIVWLGFEVIFFSFFFFVYWLMFIENMLIFKFLVNFDCSRVFFFFLDILLVIIILVIGILFCLFFLNIFIIFFILRCVLVFFLGWGMMLVWFFRYIGLYESGIEKVIFLLYMMMFILVFLELIWKLLIILEMDVWRVWKFDLEILFDLLIIKMMLICVL